MLLLRASEVSLRSPSPAPASPRAAARSGPSLDPDHQLSHRHQLLLLLLRHGAQQRHTRARDLHLRRFSRDLPSTITPLLPRTLWVQQCGGTWCFAHVHTRPVHRLWGEELSSMARRRWAANRRLDSLLLQQYVPPLPRHGSARRGSATAPIQWVKVRHASPHSMHASPARSEARRPPTNRCRRRAPPPR